uniref:Eukaryotic translation initiation factor 3 subunit A n=1 Tax=Nematostella vectensis TaxID=45351 RepID=EIF3A_NEMVE|nr:RecName: Full=Eukaryotic translation initiation factor 3 subunit A; Short=eIF3a; AltName: Full=Eukaryotic translation initiation factor 3 subunit 10 [Nematostella vectensis]
MPTYFQRPENALKRANEFIEVGKKEPALDALYDVIKSKKHRTWQNKIHEPILFKYLELCVDLRRSHVAKEGLYQYKLICQQVNIASLEDVIRYFLKLAESRAVEAQEDSRKEASAELDEDVDIEDLDQIQTPESLLLSFVSGEDTQDRTDRVKLTPWVKFLWEAYRNVLELLRNNVRVEKLYHETAQQAFKFCLKYTRRTEFRKLCDNLRNHLNVTLKHQGQPNSVNLNNPDSIQMHLETRLAQLDSAISMELWQEAFKAVEDVYGLMQLSKRPPKPQVMANYYQKVALVFLKAGNFLYHACTQQRLYLLMREQKKSITSEELQKMASHVLLATLSVPIQVSLSNTEKYLELDEVAREKSKRLANLLNLQNTPTRESLLQDMLKANVLQYVNTKVHCLYQLLEKDFRPLDLCAKVNEVCQYLESCDDADLCQYIKPIQNIAVTRLLKQVSQVFQTIEFSRLMALVPFMTEFQLERMIVDIAKEKNLQVRLDHRTKSISFGLDLHVAHREEVPEGPYLQAMPSEGLRNQLTLMSVALQRSIFTIQHDHIKAKKREEQEQMAQNYLRTARKEHKLMLERKTVIEARKEYLESVMQERERREYEKIKKQKVENQEAEQKRLDEERRQREIQRRRQELQDIEKRQAMDKIAALKKTTVGAKALKDLSPEEIDNMNADDIIAKQVEQLDKEKRELQTKLKTQEKKVDYFARAMRMEEIPLLNKQYEEHLVADREFWENQEEERVRKAIEEHEKLVETSARLQRMIPDKDAFINTLRESRTEEYQAKFQAFQAKLEQVRKERLEVRRKRRIKDRKERKKIEMEEAKKREQEEKERKKEEKERIEREEREAKEREYAERIAKQNEIDRKRREKELEIERRLEERAGVGQVQQIRCLFITGWGDHEDGGDRWRDERGGDRGPDRGGDKPGAWRPKWQREEPDRGGDRWRGGDRRDGMITMS